jgi:GH15 family glucan-1,4-alpha-glucosidase
MSDDSREVISNILNWDKELQTFWQSKGTKDLDASMPLIWFISPVDPMWRSTVKVIEARLVEDTLIRRYQAERTHVDGIPGGEVASLRAHFGTSNTFSACRELEKPQLLFEKLLGYANHLGLYSEIGSKRATSR